jgi:hypothetical protein
MLRCSCLCSSHINRMVVNGAVWIDRETEFLHGVTIQLPCECTFLFLHLTRTTNSPPVPIASPSRHLQTLDVRVASHPLPIIQDSNSFVGEVPSPNTFMQYVLQRIPDQSSSLIVYSQSVVPNEYKHSVLVTQHPSPPPFTNVHCLNDPHLVLVAQHSTDWCASRYSHCIRCSVLMVVHRASLSIHCPPSIASRKLLVSTTMENDGVKGKERDTARHAVCGDRGARRSD